MDVVTDMDVEVEKLNDVIIIKLDGELDSSTARGVQDELLPYADANEKILLDMSNVTYLSSAGLRTLLLLYRHINDHTGRIVITGLRDEIRDVMAITGFLDFFETVSDRAGALSALD